MSASSERDEYLVELNRVTDRLRTMPMTRLPLAASLTQPVLDQLARLTGAPAAAPVIEERAIGDQLAVIGIEVVTCQVPVHDPTVLLRELRLALP